MNILVWIFAWKCPLCVEPFSMIGEFPPLCVLPTGVRSQKNSFLRVASGELRLCPWDTTMQVSFQKWTMWGNRLSRESIFKTRMRVEEIGFGGGCHNGGLDVHVTVASDLQWPPVATPTEWWQWCLCWKSCGVVWALFLVLWPLGPTLWPFWRWKLLYMLQMYFLLK